MFIPNDSSNGDRPYGALLDPAAYPALMALPRYAAFYVNGECGELLHLHEAIEHDDIEAVAEFVRLRPRLLALQDPPMRLSPPLVAAVARGHRDVVARLLAHRDAMPLALRGEGQQDPVEADPDARGRWGTPLTTACARARLDLMQLLLDRMPETDVNAPDNIGCTPLLAAAAGSAIYGGSSTSPDDSADRVRLLRFLLERGANPRATQQLFLSGGADREMRRMALLAGIDCGPDTQEVPSVVDIPGGGGTALVLSVARSVSDPAIIAALVDAGVNIHQGYLGSPARFDGSRRDKDDGDEEEEEGEEEKERDEVIIGAEDSDDSDSDVGDKDATPDADSVGYTETDYDDDDDDDDDVEDDGYSGCVEEDIYMTPLAAAALYHNTTGIAALLQHGAAPDLTATAIDPVLFPGHALLPLHPMLPLHAAVAGRPFHPLAPNSALYTIALLTDDPAVCAATINATCRGYTPLALVTQNYQSFQCLPVVRALLDRGADPGIRPPAGPGPLLALFASLPRWHRTMACSIQSDADEEDEEVAPWVAAEEAVDMEALLRDLLPRGSGPDADAQRLEAVNEATAMTGNTALHLAARYGLRRSQAALLSLGARVDIRNRAGHVPMIMA